MEFRFHCLVVRHASGRVTVTPLELPELAVHATTVERAAEDLVLAIDDRISRAHPRRIIDFARPGGGDLVDLDVPAVPVWNADGSEMRPLRVTGVLAAAHKPFVEIRAPRLDTRLWLQGKSVTEQAAQLLEAHLRAFSEDFRLSVRREGVETLLELVVEATPLRLSALKRRELTMDERPPPRPPDEEEAEPDPDAAAADPDDDADEAIKADADDDWDDDKPRRRRGAKGPKAPKKVPTPTLRKIGSPWHELAAGGGLEPAHEREEITQRLQARLAVKDAEPIVLVGPAGVGKTAILHQLARRLAAAATKTTPARPFWFVDGSRLIAGEGFFGDWQQQAIDCLAEARRAEAILSLGHVVDLLDAGKSAYSDQNVAQLLLPALAAREAAVVGEATPEEWARIERRNASFARVFSVLRVDEPTFEATGRILLRVGAAEAGARGLAVTPAAVDETLHLCRRFKPYGSLVGNAVTFLRRLIDARAHAVATSVTGRDAIDLFSSESGIPPVLLRDDLPLEPANVRAFLVERVMGQEAAVARVAEIVSVIKAGLADLKRPVGVLFFAGPTGVGKTELSKALAELVFGARDRLVRLDMGEYAGPDALSRLVGEGRGQGGHLTSAVRRQPFCVLLFDEIEKAHPAVFDALLGVLGEGRLTDADGRFTDFRNAVIVMTSNLGAETWRTRMGFGGAGGSGALPDVKQLREHYVGEMQKFFRPELYNRIDDVVVFAPLDAPRLRAIVRREVGLVARRAGFRRHDVALDVDDAALELLATRGLDPRYGARPLKRAIERDLVVPIGAWLADHPEKRAAIRLSVSAPDGALALGAESLGGAEEGVSRQSILDTLDRAAVLRAEVRRWTRSRPMVALRQNLAFFDKASKQPAFWSERSLAEDAARRAAEGRELSGAFDDVARQVEAAEDLIFEAYYQRSVKNAETLAAELELTRRAFEPLQERLYATLFPPRGAVTLTLVPGKGGWAWLCWLVDAYAAWAKDRGVRIQHCTALHVDPKDRPDGKKKDPAAAWKWKVHRAKPEDAPTPAAVVLQLSGGKQLMLLAAEHGTHRFQEAGSTTLVRVRFEPEGHSLAQLLPPHELEPLMPEAEIRRIWPRKKGREEGVLRDLRNNSDHKFGDGPFDLGAVLASWMQWRIFQGEKD